MHVYVNRENMNRGRHVFYPPRKRHLSELFANGYGDALQFVKENHLTWCNLMCYGTSWCRNECRQAKLKLSQWPIRTKIIIIISQWGLKEKTNKLLEARENAVNLVVFNVASDWSRESGANFLDQSPSEAKPILIYFLRQLENGSYVNL